MSGSDCGLVTSAALAAIASVIRRSGDKPASAASPVSDRAAVKARRVISTACSLKCQLFKSALIFLSNSSNEVSPLTISPLMKKVGVELTFSTSLANFWSAAILSSSA